MKKSLFRVTVAAVILAGAVAAQSSAELRWSISVGGPEGPPPPPPIAPPPGPPVPPPPPPGGPILGPGPVINIGPDFMPPRWLHRWHRHRQHHRHGGRSMPPPPPRGE